MRPSLPPLGLAACAAFVASCASTTDSASGSPDRPAPAAAASVPVVLDRDFDVEIAPDVTLDLVWVAELGAFMGRTEVTWEQFLPYCAFDDPTPGVDGVSRPSKPLETHPFDRGWGLGEHPAVGMSWNSAKLYCDWLCERTGRTFRLPSEAEWRIACGDEHPDVAAEAWTAADGARGTADAGTKLPNQHGLHDMLGSLAEYVAGPDGSEPAPLASMGGSFMTPISEVGPDARLEFDYDWTLEDSNWPPGRWWIPGGDQLGFRVLCEDTP